MWTIIGYVWLMLGSFYLGFTFGQFTELNRQDKARRHLEDEMLKEKRRHG